MRYQNIFERADQANEVVGILQIGLTVDGDGNMIEITSDPEFRFFLKQHYRVIEIGSGAYSIVFAGTGGRDFVLKSSRTGLKAHYDRWYRFAKIARANQQNSLMPRILFSGEPAWDSELKYGVLEYLDIRLEDELNQVAEDAFGAYDFFTEC